MNSTVQVIPIVLVPGDGAEAVRRAWAEAHDLILLAVMLPNKDGYEVCRELRRGGLIVPIMMLTAKGHEAEKILGLDLGAAECVIKPFSHRELRAQFAPSSAGTRRKAIN